MTRWLLALPLVLCACLQAPPPPAEPPPPAPAPEVQASTPQVAPAPTEIVRFVPVRDQLVALACTGTTLEGGEACDDDVPLGGQVEGLDGSLLTLEQGQPRLLGEWSCGS